MRQLVVFVMVVGSVSTAAAESVMPQTQLFPPDGVVPSNPQIWIASVAEPSVSVRTPDGGDVEFELGREEEPFDDVFVDGGTRWTSLYVKLERGPFVVAVGDARGTYVAEPVEQSYAADYVEFERASIVSTPLGDLLAIDAIARDRTVMYFLAREGTEDDVWIGPGLALGPEPSHLDGSRRRLRFAIHLEKLGLDCKGRGERELSLYSTTDVGYTTLYPVATIEVDRGRVKLPMELVRRYEEDSQWQPCPGAVIRARAELRSETAPPETAPPETASLRRRGSGLALFGSLGAVWMLLVAAVVAFLARRRSPPAG